MKHYVIYFENEAQVTTTPREWARLNQDHFPTFDFSTNDTSNTPNTETVARHLTATGFKAIDFDSKKLFVRI